jgi:pantoate--beta-alanine ligase
MSRRNSYRAPAARAAATVRFRALVEAWWACREGERDPRQLAALVRGAIEKEPLARVDYVEAVDPLTLEPAVGLPVLVAAAVFIGGTRLIDNVLLEEPETAAP